MIRRAGRRDKDGDRRDCNEREQPYTVSETS
jgi:hypothetical protein